LDATNPVGLQEAGELFRVLFIGDDPAVLDAHIASGKVDIRRPMPNGFSLVHRAVSENRPRVLLRLIELGADINGSTDLSEWTPLYTAVNWGNWFAAEVLIASGADVNRKTSSQRTPLHRAALHGNARVVQLLLEAGADPTAVDAAGDRAIDLALMRDRRAVCDMLTKSKIP
jgi:ankyrin repeat protein